MPAPISIEEYLAQMQKTLQRPLSTKEMERIERCDCGQAYCSGWKLIFQPEDTPPTLHMEV